MFRSLPRAQVLDTLFSSTRTDKKFSVIARSNATRQSFAFRIQFMKWLHDVRNDVMMVCMNKLKDKLSFPYSLINFLVTVPASEYNLTIYIPLDNWCIGMALKPEWTSKTFCPNME